MKATDLEWADKFERVQNLRRGVEARIALAQEAYAEGKLALDQKDYIVASLDQDLKLIALAEEYVCREMADAQSGVA